MIRYSRLLADKLGKLLQPFAATVYRAVLQAGKVRLLSDEARTACQATVTQCQELSAKLQQLSSLQSLLEAAEAQVHRESAGRCLFLREQSTDTSANRCSQSTLRG